LVVLKGVVAVGAQAAADLSAGGGVAGVGAGAEGGDAELVVVNAGAVGAIRSFWSPAEYSMLVAVPPVEEVALVVWLRLF